MSLISIIVPCYNQAQYLDECLQSVLNQTFRDWECIVVNDGSPDSTEEIVKKWMQRDERINYIIQKNQGVSAARNSGIKAAKGKYIQFLDADDLLEKNKIAYQVKILEQNPEIAIVYGGSRYFFDGEIKLFSIHPSGMIPTLEMQFYDENQLDAILLHNVCTICAPLYRSSIFEHLKFKNVVFEDYLLNIECIYNGSFFHFEKEIDGNCLIRITANSQMESHKQRNNASNEFKKYVAVATDNYMSVLQPLSDNNSSKKTQKTFTIKNILRLITPPIFIKLLKK
ncbi:MAG: glycosyltransferase [Weeksellaceae bacterium]|nr:glycosyltransferase [Weeksellaceae bacterium]